MFLIWQGNIQPLSLFANWLNNIQTHLTFTFVVKKKKNLPFLDFFLQIQDGKIGSTSYRKTIKINTLLMYTSNQPRGLCDDLLYGQFTYL